MATPNSSDDEWFPQNKASSSSPKQQYTYEVTNNYENPDVLESTQATQKPHINPHDLPIHPPVMIGANLESITEKRQFVERQLSCLDTIGDIIKEKLYHLDNPLQLNDIIRCLQKAKKEGESAIMYSNMTANENYRGFEKGERDPLSRNPYKKSKKNPKYN
jgi:hypothetical protein